MQTKYIIVTGGVCSGLGKGITSASIGALLKASGFSVFSLKLDPYLNVDPGTMSPFRHGEVFVTEDGAETDLDLGHYERFIDIHLTQLSSLAAGKIYRSVLDQEREGVFLGRDVQMIPHITDAIKDHIKKVGEYSKADVVLVEIGGTAGDVEGEVFLEAVRQLALERENDLMFVHLVLLPYLVASKELKTKPAQTSVRILRQSGIQPDMIIARADHPIEESHLEKLSLFCSVKREAVIPAETADSIYFVPEQFAYFGVAETIMKKLGLTVKKTQLDSWYDLTQKIRSAKQIIRIGMVGKYNALEDAYFSIIESLRLAGYHQGLQIDFVWIDAEDEFHDLHKKLLSVDGVVVLPGFGRRGSKGKIAVAQYARENKLPYFGICLGSQIMAIEFAQNVLGLVDANSEEFDTNASHKIIHMMQDQKHVTSKGGTMRLGAYDCILKAGTQVAQIYDSSKVSERHRHRYEFNNEYREQFENNGFIISGTSPDGNLVEMVEIQDHPFMIGTQAHPEFHSRPHKPHPLFRGFLEKVQIQSTKV